METISLDAEIPQTLEDIRRDAKSERWSGSHARFHYDVLYFPMLKWLAAS